MECLINQILNLHWLIYSSQIILNRCKALLTQTIQEYHHIFLLENFLKQFQIINMDLSFSLLLERVRIKVSDTQR